MTLDEALLAKLAEWRPAGDGPHSFHAPLAAPGWTLALTADRADTVGCRATELGVARPAGPEPVSAAGRSSRSAGSTTTSPSSTRS